VKKSKNIHDTLNNKNNRFAERTLLNVLHAAELKTKQKSKH
jgi:hypothetical protein